MSIDDINRLISAHAHKEHLGLAGVHILEVTNPTQPTPAIAEPILAVTMQGAKRVALGDHVYESFIANKKIEWDDYRRHITDYELRRYLPVL